MEVLHLFGMIIVQLRQDRVGDTTDRRTDDSSGEIVKFLSLRVVAQFSISESTPDDGVVNVADEGVGERSCKDRTAEFEQLFHNSEIRFAFRKPFA